jgi:hypothetical protein
MKFQDCWNEEWKAVRHGIHNFHGVRVEQSERAISLIREYSMEGASRIIQKFELSADRPWIEVDILLHKDKVTTPEAIYFVSQLNLEEGWQASYDSSGIPVKLDEQQLDNTSNGWVTAGAFNCMEDRQHQFCVFAPGMPLVQFGGFNFGKPKKEIPRPANPLHLGWACNNYWETNYPVTQEGVIRYNCAIYTSSGESQAQTYQMADAFARKPLFLPLASCAEPQSESLLRIDNPNVRLVSIDQSKAHEGIICRLVNHGKATACCTLELIREIQAAAIISPTEDILGDCALDGSTVTIDIPANGVVSILVNLN